MCKENGDWVKKCVEYLRPDVPDCRSGPKLEGVWQIFESLAYAKHVLENKLDIVDL